MSLRNKVDGFCSVHVFFVVGKFESCFLLPSFSRGVGGLLTLWDSSEVEVWSTVNRQPVLLIH